MTSKGALVRAILFPKPIEMRIYADLIKVAALFFIMSIGGMIYSTFVWVKNGVIIYWTII